MLFYQVKAACSLVDNGRMKNAYEQSQNCWFILIEDIIRSAIGLNQFRPNMHMVFTSNPGSAKTTVASVEPHPYI